MATHYKVLQVCNVGQIVGGTAACVWTITKCFPECEHHVAFRSSIRAETRKAFSHCHLREHASVNRENASRHRYDLVMLHNTPEHRSNFLSSTPNLQFLHSRISPAVAEKTLFCSHWLARQYRQMKGTVCHQAVPRPKRPSDRDADSRTLRRNPVIGRICTPTRAKWPAHLTEFYSKLAKRFPKVFWEFVGCPDDFQRELNSSCRGRASFFPASWQQRTRYWYWDALLYHNPQVTESFGRTVAEAMRAGCVPIVDRRGGFIEQVGEKCGFLCDSLEDFCIAVDRIHSTQERLLISQTCRTHADRHFSLKSFRKRLLDVITECAQDNSQFDTTLKSIRNSESLPR